ncbi:sensor histidine kinase [Novipirellula herctigrandis]
MIAELLIGRNIGESNLKRTAACLREDPPLFLFAAVSSGSLSGSQCVTLADLAVWLTDNVSGVFANSDAFLGAPVLTEAQQRRWSELYGFFKTLPQNRWIAEGHLWLEVSGTAVPTEWREQWPSITFEAETYRDEVPFPSADVLQQLARKMQHLDCIERSFDRRLHKSKLAALKQLTYGLSHEINNPLANISTRAQQLQRDEVDPRRQQTLQKIVNQVYRAHEMIADLMFYSNPPQPQMVKCDLNGLVVSVTDEFEGELERLSIRLETQTSREPVTVDADSEMIGEALRVLLRNSIDAIGNDGTIVASVVRDDDRVMIHVADSGPGLSRQARQHAFDPYFSGREAGRGLGLGLCRAYRIAKMHHAEITLAGGPVGCVATISFSWS